MKFSDFSLPETLEGALQRFNFQTPTPIQAQAIPPALEGKDLIATAQTGTGKTAAFCLPIAAKLLRSDRKSTALVLVPTRELALQIETFWRDLTRATPILRAACIIGGSSFSNQIKVLVNKPRMIIATPGRLVDHLQQKTLRLSDVETLVLDEADRMLDMGFAPQLRQVFGALPVARQTLLFSATWQDELYRLIQKQVKNPVRVSVGETSRAALTIQQSVLPTTSQKKNETLLGELNKSKGSVLVFTRTKARTDRLARYLSSYGLGVGRLHGGRSLGQRKLALSAFRGGHTRILVATDLAARGIDVADIAQVINYDLPQVPEDYVHRIGRTGRAGASGNALSLVTPEDRGQWKDILKHLERTGSQIPSAK